MTILIVILNIFVIIFCLWVCDALTRKEFVQEAVVTKKSTIPGFRDIAFLNGSRLPDTMTIEDRYFLKLQFKDGRTFSLQVDENVYRRIFAGQRFPVKCTKGILGLRVKSIG